MKDKEPLIGYVRISTKTQSTHLQVARLQQYAAEQGCDIEIYTDTASGKPGKKRPGLETALRRAEEIGCPIVVTRIDRLSRSVDAGKCIIAHIPCLIVLDEDADTPDKQGQLLRQAEAERIKTSKATKKALTTLQEQLDENFISSATEEHRDIMRIDCKAQRLSKRYRRYNDETRASFIDFAFWLVVGKDADKARASEAQCDKCAEFIADILGNSDCKCLVSYLRRNNCSDSIPYIPMPIVAKYASPKHNPLNAPTR